MIVWTGKGFVVFIFIMLAVICSEYVSEFLTGDEQFYDQNPWVLMVGMMVAAVCIYVFHRFYLLREKSKIVIDKETGEELDLKESHSLFFMPVKWWPLIMIFLGFIWSRSP